MLVPTVANRITWLYAAGNTPATSLTRSLPHGQDATVLSLGCGDLRNILFTAYSEKGLPQRKLDITCCDINERIIARNVILLSFLLDTDEKLDSDDLWDAYYHLFVNRVTADALLKRTTKLLSISNSLEDWDTDIYGRAIKFCDFDTLTDVRKFWEIIKAAAEKCTSADYLKDYQKNVYPSKDCHDQMVGKDAILLTGMRSAAPLSLQSQHELPSASSQYWKDGTVTPKPDDAQFPNPLLGAILSDTDILHYGNDPVLGYHLAAAYAPLLDSSPLNPEDPELGFHAAAAAKTQFDEWSTAFRQVFGKKIVIRYVVADALTFCHTLQQSAVAKTTSANMYRRTLDSRPLILDQKVYGKGSTGPTAFDIIDTSNLSDHFGAINIIVAAGPLLKDQPWAALFTELLIKQEGDEKRALEKILCGHVPTVSLLLGFSPVQYWTNAKCESHVDEIFLSGMGRTTSKNEETQFRIRSVWKRDDSFAGYPKGGSKLHIEAKPLAKILLPIVRRMFESESPTAGNSRTSAYPHFHRGSLAALLKLVSRRVETDWPITHAELVDLTSQERALMLNSNQTQDFGTQLHLMGVGTEAWLLSGFKDTTKTGMFNAWESIPPVLAVTVVIPRQTINRLYEGSFQQKLSSPRLIGSLRTGPNSVTKWHNMFGDVQLSFGKVKTTSYPECEDFEVSVQRAEKGWSGNSSLVASFYVPTAALQVEPENTLIGLSIPPSAQSGMIYVPILGMDLVVFETEMMNSGNVFVTKYLPDQKGYPLVCSGSKSLDNTVDKGHDDRTVKITADIPASESTIGIITARLDITSTKGKSLLKEKVPIELKQKDPFVINVIFADNKLVCPVRFPIPVTKDGMRSRVARTTGYIEIIAPVADAGSSGILSDFIFPVGLSSSGVPFTTNTPHVNLDALPIVDLGASKDRLRWLTSLTSLQFSTREKRLRDVANEGTGIAEDPRVNFKESLFTMFMLSSGLQGGQTGMFAINHPEQGGIHMLIFVSALRLDGDNASVVLDAAVIPFTTRLIESGKMEAFLLLIRTLECCTLNVNDAELILWKKILPSLAERCRTWSHRSTCEYKRKNSTIPISLEHGEQVICSCGNGHIPEKFVSLPEWENAGPNAVRVAINPTYSVPFVEEVVAQSLVAQMGSVSMDTERCRKCGKTQGSDGGSLKKCLRCMKVKYCSGECQKKDWKKHRNECSESG